MNTQQRHLNNYEQIGGTKDLLNNRARIKRLETIEINETKAASEIGLMSTTVGGLKEIISSIRASALRAGSDSSGPSELLVFGQELQGLAKDFFDGVNTQLNGKYLFSGLATDKKVFDIDEGQIYSTGEYLEGYTYAGNRVIENKKASVGLDDLFAATASAANYTGSVPSPATLASAAEMNLVINDGYNTYNLGDISFTAGDNVSNMVTKINAAFTAAGGSGAIAQVSGGAIDFDTSLVTGNIENSAAAIIISPGSSLPNTLGDLGLEAGTTTGTSTNIQTALAKLLEAYNSEDNQAVRQVLVDLDAMLDAITSVETELGDIEARFADSISSTFNLRTDLEIKESDLATIPIAEAIQEVNAAQAAMGGAMQASALVLQQSVFRFLSL